MDFENQPITAAYGMGVDSTAMIIEMVRRKIRPRLIMFADVGNENEKTYAYKPVMDAYLAAHDFPPITVVRYVPKKFKHWPPYYTLEENCLTNGTLPSISFGFKSCSQKWKVAPQNNFVKTWPPATFAWAQGLRVIKAIGYDAGPKDIRRCNHVGEVNDPRYEYWYPLVEWGWDRERCIREIEREGLPVPVKSSCFFCAAMKPHEVEALSPEKLRRVVAMEARAKPRLIKIEGLWRKSSKKRPGTMTQFIRDRGLLPAEEIDNIIATTPDEILSFQKSYAVGEHNNGCSSLVKQISAAPGPGSLFA